MGRTDGDGKDSAATDGAFWDLRLYVAGQTQEIDRPCSRT